MTKQERIEVLREAAVLQCQFCKRTAKYGVAEREPAFDLFAHKRNGARWCEANNIQKTIAALEAATKESQ